MFDIVHKLFSLPACVGGGVSVGWIGLSEAEVRPALLIIGQTKYSPTDCVSTKERKCQVDESIRVEATAERVKRRRLTERRPRGKEMVKMDVQEQKEN